MTMQPSHSPKPRVFGPGYGTHLAYNFSLVKICAKLVIKLFINAFIPGVYYEEAHWRVIDLYYKMSGRRYGTNNSKRCDHCGSILEPKQPAEPHVINIVSEEKPSTSSKK